jgi:hypothetical protein
MKILAEGGELRLPTPIRTMSLIAYRGEIVAVPGASRVHLSPQLEALDSEDPFFRFVLLMVAYYLSVREGRAPGPYTDERAELFARLVLMDDDEFRSVDREGLEDVLIAGHFGVPIEQVDEKRHDLRSG